MHLVVFSQLSMVAGWLSSYLSKFWYIGHSWISSCREVDISFAVFGNAVDKNFTNDSSAVTFIVTTTS